MKYGAKQLFCFLALPTMLAAPYAIAAEDSPPAPIRGQNREESRSSRSSRTYDEWFTHRKDVFTKDPYIWVYNESFAKDFRMPDRWIDKDLQGADALAFRTGTSFPLCGWSRNPKSCKPMTMCLVEMYFHHARNPLPWDDRLRWTDLQIDLTSIWTLSSLRSVHRAPSQEGRIKSPFTDPKSGNELDWWFVLASRSAPYGGPTWLAYDRSAFESYSLVVLDTRCPAEPMAKLELRSFPSVDPSGKVFHAVTFPKGWRDRMGAQIKTIEEQERKFFQERLNELKTDQ